MFWTISFCYCYGEPMSTATPRRSCPLVVGGFTETDRAEKPGRLRELLHVA
jgi:hypothetical protein